MYNGYVPHKAGETSDHQNYPVPANNAAAQLVISKADALTVSQIYLEDQQRKINEAQARLNMERAHLVEIARQQAMEAHLNAEIAAGEEAKLEALNFERQRSLGSMNSSNVYQLPTYEPTPSTTRIVPVEDEHRQYSGAQGNTWSNSSIVPNMSMRPNANATPNHPHRTQQTNLQNLGPQSHYVAGAQARPQVPALTHQYQSRQAFPSQSSTSAHQPQFTQSYQPSQAAQPAQLMRNQHQSQRPQQQSAQQQSNFQPSRPSLQTSSTQSQQSIASQPALTPQIILARQRQSVTSSGQQFATQEPVPQIPTLNQVPPSKSHGKPVPSVTSASTSQTHSQSIKPAGRQTSGAIANLANPSRDTKHGPPSNPVTKVPSQSRPTQSAMANPAALSKQIEDLSPMNQRRLSSMHKYAYQWLKQAEVGATESIPLTGLFIHCPATGQAQIGEIVNNKFTPMTPIGWIKALQKMVIPEVSQTVSAPANAPPSVTPTTVADAPPHSNPVSLPPTATATKLKGHAESLVNALNSAHEHPTTPLPSLSRKNSNITGSPRTPGDANRKSLARDVLFALGSVREKRQRESFGESDGRTAKRTALSNIPVPVAQSTVSSNQPPMVSSFPVQAPAFNYQHPSVISQPAVPQLPSDQSNVARQDKPSDVISAVPSHQAGPSSQANVNPDAAPVVTKPSKFVMENIPVAGPSRFVGRISQAITNFNTAITSSTLQTAPVASPPKLAPISISQNRLIPEQLPARSPPKVNVTPLFLPETPSPPTSPPPIPNMDEESLCLAESVTVRGSDIEPVDDFRARKGQTVTVVDCVQVPSAPGWVKRDLARRMWKSKERQEEEEQAEIESVIEILDSDEEPEPRKTKEKYSRRTQSSREASDFLLPTPVRDPQELAALKKSITRLHECMCKWGGCEVILSSTEKLGQHMRNHVVESQQDKYGNPILCKICGKHEAQNPDHVENHAYHQLCCPYEGCDESFRSSRKLSQHSLKYHCDDQLRPSAEPYFPFQPASPPDIPSTLPSYMVVARAVTPHPISAQRHQVLGPWVLKNMMPPVDSVSLKRYLKAKHLGRVEAPTTSDEYEFLVSRSSHSCMPSRPAKIRDFGDLNSDQVSQLINDGMSFWQEEKKDEETAFSEPGNSPSPSELPADADGSGVPSRRSTDELVLSGIGFDEELL
ncbi:hypothetical protein F5877DRAFT_74076 [Lentinula edodes]|nr:hypothetical protein F5877DRAFT_74076 [Lentinula edodes]